MKKIEICMAFYAFDLKIIKKGEFKRIFLKHFKWKTAAALREEKNYMRLIAKH